MNINKLAFQDGKDDYLDSTGYFPTFWLFLEPGSPALVAGSPDDVSDALDSYAMGFELASAFAKLMAERMRLLIAMEKVTDVASAVSKSALWGNNK